MSPATILQNRQSLAMSRRLLSAAAGYRRQWRGDDHGRAEGTPVDTVSADGTARETSRGRYRNALAVRDLRTLIIAFLVDGGASWSYNVVLVAYIYERTHSATWITTLVTARWIVGIVAGGYAGVLADRYDRRNVLLASAASAMVVALVIALAVGTDAPLVTIVIAAAALSAVTTPINPASGALIPEVVHESELVAANAV